MYAIITPSERLDATGPPAPTGGAYLVGNLSRSCDGCGRCGLYPCALTAQRWAGVVGAGPCVAPRDRATLSCGYRHAAPPYHGHPVAPCGCALGDGGRVALPCSSGGDWRGLGRPGSPQFHRDQTTCPAFRGRGCRLLADPSRGHTRPQCGTRSVADRLAPIRPTPARCTGTGQATLVAESVPFKAQKAGTLDGGI